MTHEEREDIIRQLCSFKNDKWLEWIDGIFNNNPQEPILSFREADLVNSLFWVYNNLSEVKQPKENNSLLLFNKTLIFYLSEIVPVSNNSDKIFSLIYYIDNTRIFQCRSQIENIILSERFDNLFFGSVNLHLYLIKAYTFIDSTVSLREYLKVKLNASNEPYFYYVFLNYYFTCLGYEEGLKKLSFLLYNNISKNSIKDALLVIKEYLLETKKIESFVNWYSTELQTVLKNYALIANNASFLEVFEDADFQENDFFKNNIYYELLLEMIKSEKPIKIFKEDELKLNLSTIKHLINNTGLRIICLNNDGEIIQNNRIDSSGWDKSSIANN